MCRQLILHSITLKTIRATIWKAKDSLSDPVVARGFKKRVPEQVLGRVVIQVQIYRNLSFGWLFWRNRLCFSSSLL